MVRRALLLAVVLSAAPSRAQDAPPAPPPAPRPSASPTPAGEDDSALRRETGRLAMTLVARRTRPEREWVRLSVEVSTKGALVDRTRVLDVSVVRRPEVRFVRVRFREPANLRGRAILVRTPARGEERAWSYDPARRRAERIAPPADDERLGGTGLTWADLRGEEPARWSYRLVEEGRLRVGEGSERPVLRISARARAGSARRRITLDRQARLPLLVEELSPEGAVARRLWFRRYARFGEGGFRAGKLAIEHAEGKRLSEVRALERRGEVPPRHLDPDRFGASE